MSTKEERARLVELVEPLRLDVSMVRLTLELEYRAAEYHHQMVEQVFDRFLEIDDDLAELFDLDQLRYRADLGRAQGELLRFLRMERDVALAHFDETLANLVSYYRSVGLLPKEQDEEPTDG